MQHRVLVFLFTTFFAATGISVELMFLVNSENPVVELSKSELRDYYFKRKRKWPDGTSVRFLDRKSESPIRKKFFSDILNKTPDEVELYWIGQKLYTGDSSPLKESSDAMAFQFVKSFKGAISYVAEGARLPEGVKAIRVR